MQASVSCIVVDDDELDRLSTLSFIRKYPFLSLGGVFSDAESALREIVKINPQVLFLDIDMPGLSGLQLRQQLMHIPACIFITSYAEYAVDSFEKDALDFLVKPIRGDRFDKAMDRLQEFLTVRKKASLLDSALGTESFFIKDGHQQIKINFHEILYLEALKDYTSIVTTGRKYCVHSALGNLIMEPPFSSFVRVHRSYAVQRNYIRKISASEVSGDNFTLPIGRAYKNALTNL